MLNIDVNRTLTLVYIFLVTIWVDFKFHPIIVATGFI